MPHRLVIALAVGCLQLPPLAAQAPATPRPKGAIELRADSLLRVGNPIEAERLYRQLAQADSTLLRAWYGVGNAAAAQQRNAEAAEAFERAAVGGRLIAAVYNAGAMHSRLGNIDAAIVTIRGWGFVLEPGQLEALAAQMGEGSLLARTGGAPSLAVGMAQVFAGAFGPSLTALWYHFAIMFEALFILTTVDTGTRVGRFMVQELAGHVWKPLGRTSWYPASVLASAAIVAAWGWFLLQGVQDPLGGINALWPLFGISNQLLAAVALTVATTLIIRSGRARYAWTTILPLCWVLLVTTTASWQKLFHTDPRIGFLAHATKLATDAANGTMVQATASRLILNDRINAVLVAAFVLVTWAVVVSGIRVWTQRTANGERRTAAEAAV